MFKLIYILPVFISLFFFIGFLSLVIMFHNEDNRRGVRRSVLLLVSGLLLILLSWHFSVGIIFMSVAICILIFFLSFIFFTAPTKGITDPYPVSQSDERDIMFSRNELVPGTGRFREYYERNPEYFAKDELLRKEPGLLKKGTRYYDEKIFEDTGKIFGKVEKLYPFINGEVETKPGKKLNIPDSMEIKNFLLAAGARHVGICLLKDYHFYSYKGRGEEYGRKIERHHKYAIAFTVEMRWENLHSAPAAPAVRESALRYLESGKLAVELADRIRKAGIDARAHIDGNYEIICPLVARDAGLGEIGRMGLLMTPDLGPRVRIAVVSTDLELQPDSYTCNNSILEFCLWCRKCAGCCPAGSISKAGPVVIDGVKRWKTDQESCFTFWCKAGTDCGRCMSVCPYSHPPTGMHTLIRRAISKSRLARYLAVHLDDFFYGKKPKPGPYDRDRQLFTD